MLPNIIGSFFGKIANWISTPTSARENGRVHIEDAEGLPSSTAEPRDGSLPVSTSVVQMEVEESYPVAAELFATASENDISRKDQFGPDALLLQNDEEPSISGPRPAPPRSARESYEANDGMESPPPKRKCPVPDGQKNVPFTVGTSLQGSSVMEEDCELSTAQKTSSNDALHVNEGATRTTRKRRTLGCKAAQMNQLGTGTIDEEPFAKDSQVQSQSFAVPVMPMETGRSSNSVQTRAEKYSKTKHLAPKNKARSSSSSTTKKRSMMPENSENAYPTSLDSSTMPSRTGKMSQPSTSDDSNLGVDTLDSSSSSAPTTRKIKILEVPPPAENTSDPDTQHLQIDSDASDSDEDVAEIERSANAPPVVYKRHISKPAKAAKFWFPRQFIIPVGINRQPYHIPIPESCTELVSRFRVQDDPHFPKSVEGARTVLRKKQRKVSNIAEYPDDRSSNTVAGLADIEEYLGPCDQDYKDQDDKEMEMWSSSKFEEHSDQLGLNQNEFYKAIKDMYLFVIWRQFEGRIPQEYALFKLKTCNYNIAEALESIDQLLKVLPQKLKDPNIAQVQILRDEMRPIGDPYNLRNIQDYVMRNYHMSEVFDFSAKFRRFYAKDTDPRELTGDGLQGKISCNCAFEECRQLDFEPRYGCSNCTKTLRRNPLPPGKLCLICTTYTKTTGKTRPANDVVFDQDDLEKIELWDQRCSALSREEFEKWNQKQKNERYKKLELTQEEVLSLNLHELMRKVDSKKNKKTEEPTLGEKVCSMLQPVVLPHFPICQCVKSGSIPFHSPDYGKINFSEKFSDEEIQEFVAAISAKPGDIKSAARTLGKPEELVEIFLRKYNARNDVWNNLPDGVSVHKYTSRKIYPTINPPPSIPRTDTVQKFA